MADIANTFCKYSELDISDDNPLPDGTFPLFLSQTTQEKFECVSEWDLSILEPHKIVPVEKILEDLKDDDSDFSPLKEQINVRVNIYTNLANE